MRVVLAWLCIASACLWIAAVEVTWEQRSGLGQLTAFFLAVILFLVTLILVCRITRKKEVQ